MFLFKLCLKSRIIHIRNAWLIIYIEVRNYLPCEITLHIVDFKINDIQSDQLPSVLMQDAIQSCLKPDSILTKDVSYQKYDI